MRLAEALRIQAGMTAAFVGAGGKSAAMARLTHELAEEQPVVVSTTTKLALRQTQIARIHLIAKSQADLKPLRKLLERHRSVLVTGPSSEREPKWLGLVPDALEAVRRICDQAGATLLVEADGARGRSLKAPAGNEPQVPDFAQLVVPVAGLDACGQPLNSPLVHRPERLSRLLWLPPNATVTPGLIARALTSPEAGLKSVPPGAEVRLLLNKADMPGAAAAGRKVAALALRQDRIRAVVLGQVLDENPVLRVYGRIAGVILAAGATRRLGRPKQLIEWEGKPLVWHAVQAGRAAGLWPLIVVVGSGAEAVRRALQDEAVTFAENPAWEAGLSSSVRAGVEAVEGTVEAIVFLLSDMPQVTPQLVKALIDEHRRTLTPLVAPRAGGRWANPVLFDRVTFLDLKSLWGDRGGRVLFDRYRIAGIAWDDAILLDIDTPADLKRLGNAKPQP
jgi:molybdenum cofactor cytidylyltransferase